MTWEWRLLDLVILPFGVFLTNQQAITTRGSIYMPLSNNDVLKFEAYSEKWTTFSLPIQTLEYPFGTTSHLIKFERKLGFAYRTTSHLWELWVLTNDESWERVHVFDTRSEDNGISSLDAIYDSDTRVMREYEAIAFYRFKGGDHIKKVLTSHHPYRIFTFRSDFEPIHLRGHKDVHMRMNSLYNKS